MITVKQTELFADWLRKLKDQTAQKVINRRLFRVSQGLFGDHKRLTNADGVHELRIDAGKGYRVYYIRKGDVLVILLCGGDKGTQKQDIEKAKNLAGEIDL